MEYYDYTIVYTDLNGQDHLVESEDLYPNYPICKACALYYLKDLDFDSAVIIFAKESKISHIIEVKKEDVSLLVK